MFTWLWLIWSDKAESCVFSVIDTDTIKSHYSYQNQRNMRRYEWTVAAIFTWEAHNFSETTDPKFWMFLPPMALLNDPLQ